MKDVILGCVGSQGVCVLLHCGNGRPRLVIQGGLPSPTHGDVPEAKCAPLGVILGVLSALSRNRGDTRTVSGACPKFVRFSSLPDATA